MLVYLDSVIVIYAVEGLPPYRMRAHTQLAALAAAGHRFAVSDLTRLECRVKPLRLHNATLLADYDVLLTASNVQKLPLTTAVYHRAAQIRADFNFKLADSLHLATAVESGCAGCLTNDTRLARFSDVTVDVLP